MIYKRLGETPLEALSRLRTERLEYRDEVLSYAGRLDPLAEGLMLVLVGSEANKKRDKYLNYDKEYCFDVLFGVGSDSYDCLGLVEKGGPVPDDIKKTLERISYDWLGPREDPYPPFSSKTVGGKPLFWWTKKGLSITDWPKKKTILYCLEVVQIVYVPISFVTALAEKKIVKVNGDFRQKQAIDSWRGVLESSNKDELLPLARFRMKGSSGIYVRVLANKMGKECGTKALAFSIVRTAIGEYSLTGIVL